ncbi:MAG TPA: 2-oxo acid dehydrogenase subunit E2 [Bacteroides sp.]|nr:2-oxo acid dehydrogenase subunit E2 [Bacteroides sp.]
MATSVILPKQGQSVENCIITEWYKKKGDRVVKGDLLFAYETDKSSFEEESQFEGILLEIFFDEGDEVPVLSEVAVIGEEGEKIEAQKQVEKTGADAPAENSQNTLTENGSVGIETLAETTVVTAAVNGNLKLKISPRARKMAELKGITLDDLPGTGPNGRIIVRDIDAVAEGTIQAAPVAQTLTTGEFEDKPLSNLRKLVAKAMHASLQNSAQLTHHLGADARSILSLRKKVKKQQEAGKAGNITLNDMICFAVIKALKSKPEANVHFIGESIRIFRKVHLGIAVDTDRGLMVPVLRNADDLSLAGLSDQIAQLASACRAGNIAPDLLQPDAATFTVSNLGNYGVEMFTPVINLPQAAILGVNTILERPARMEDGTFGFVPFLGLSLTYDHRALDGGPATVFLAEIKKEIEQFNHEIINQ